jgi:hypothetical protein
LFSILALSQSPVAQPTDLEACGDAYYSSSKVSLHASFPEPTDILTVHVL